MNITSLYLSLFPSRSRISQRCHQLRTPSEHVRRRLTTRQIGRQLSRVPHHVPVDVRQELDDLGDELGGEVGVDLVLDQVGDGVFQILKYRKCSLMLDFEE